MHFSPVTIGVTALFILAAAASSSDHVDVAAAPLPHSGQLKPAHSRFASHHRHEDGENSFVSHYHTGHRLTDDRYPSKEKRTWTGTGNQAVAKKGEPVAGQAASHTSNNLFDNHFTGVCSSGTHDVFCRTQNHGVSFPQTTGSRDSLPILHKHKRHWTGGSNRPVAKRGELLPPSTQRAVNSMLIGALFRRASAKSHNTIKFSYGNIAQLEKQSNSISQKVSSAANEYQALQKRLGGMPGAAKSSFAQKSARIRTLFASLQDLYHRQTTSLQTAQSSYRGAENKGKTLWGRSLSGLNDLSRRASSKPHPAKSIKVSSASLAQLEKQGLAIAAKVDEAWREQQTLRKSLAGSGWTGSARSAMDKVGTQIDVAFKQLHGLLHQSSPQGTYSATESKTKAVWG